MTSFKPFVLIFLAASLGMVYVTLANKTNFYTQNTLKSADRVSVQKNKVDKLKAELTDSIAAMAASHHMVKIPVMHIQEEHVSEVPGGAVNLASLKY